MLKIHSIVDEFEPNKNGWHKIGGYNVCTNNFGKIVVENEYREAFVCDYDKWFYRKENMDDFWNNNF